MRSRAFSVAMITALGLTAHIEAQTVRYFEGKRIVGIDDPAPELEDGFVYKHLPRYIKTNAYGEVFFFANAQRADETILGTWWWDGERIHKLLCDRDQRPDLPEGFTFQDGGYGFWTDNREVVFHTPVLDENGDPIHDHRTFWRRERDGSLTKAFETREPLPPEMGFPPGSSLALNSGIYINNHGDFAIEMALVLPDPPPDLDAVGCWAFIGDQLHCIARAGDTPHGFPEGTVIVGTGDSPDEMPITDTREVFFSAMVRFPVGTYGFGLYKGTPTGITPLMVPLQQAPGLPEGVTIDRVNTLPSVDRYGNYVTAARVYGPGYDESNSWFMYRDQGRGPEILYHMSEPIPGFPGLYWDYRDSPDSHFSVHHIENGDLLIFASVRGEGVTDDNFRRMFRLRRSGELEFIVATNDPVPGMPGWTFRTKASTLHSNANGYIVTVPMINDPDEEGEWERALCLIHPDNRIEVLAVDRDMAQVDCLDEPLVLRGLGDIPDRGKAFGYQQTILTHRNELVLSFAAGNHNHTVCLITLPGGDTCHADRNLDGVVDLQDLGIVLASFGHPTDSRYFDVRADLDADRDVDLQDLAAILDEWGAVCR